MRSTRPETGSRKCSRHAASRRVGASSRTATRASGRRSPPCSSARRVSTPSTTRARGTSGRAGAPSLRDGQEPPAQLAPELVPGSDALLALGAERLDVDGTVLLRVGRAEPFGQVLGRHLGVELDPPGAPDPEPLKAAVVAYERESVLR